MLGKPRAHSERTFAHKSAHLRKRAHISKVPTSTFVCHNSARAENCKTYTFHDHEHKFKPAEKSVLLFEDPGIYTFIDHNIFTQSSKSIAIEVDRLETCDLPKEWIPPYRY